MKSPVFQEKIYLKKYLLFAVCKLCHQYTKSKDLSVIYMPLEITITDIKSLCQGSSMLLYRIPTAFMRIRMWGCTFPDFSELYS